MMMPKGPGPNDAEIRTILRSMSRADLLRRARVEDAAAVAILTVRAWMSGVNDRPAGERLPYRYTTEEDDKMLYWTTACQTCSLKSQCTPGPERRITRWEHEHLLEAVQQRLDANPERCASGERRSNIPSARTLYEPTFGETSVG
jgi:hypothetical protein